jgi:hypothetical protein
MIRSFLALALLASPSLLSAQSTLRAAPSTRATAEVALNQPRAAAGQPAADTTTVKIRLDYGQPHLRGRTLHTDSLVPYGEVWRTGANGATTLTTGVDLLIGGKPVPAGVYVIRTLPTAQGWTLIVHRSDNPGTMQSAMRYDPAHDIARVELRVQQLAAPVESFTMWLIPSTAQGPARGELRMAWGSTMLSTDWEVR